MGPRITIGLPVYNGEKTIRRSIESVISQTYQEFKLIISDNASTDSTQTICEEYAKRDKRIQYIRQSKNMGPYWNILYLLNNAESEYFVWIAADDYWAPTFLEKNITILDTKKDVMASIGKTSFIFSGYYQKFTYNQYDNVARKFYKKMRLRSLTPKYFSIYGSKYEDRIKSCLKSKYPMTLYSVFRTDVLKKSVNHKITLWEHVVILTALEYGNLHVIDEVLLYRTKGGGGSDTNLIYNYLHKYIKLRQLIFPKIPFTKWCIKNLGKRIFFQNIVFFIRINCNFPVIILINLIKYIESPNTRRMNETEEFNPIISSSN
jgi:glycosyltransferase involved in cell wall biosynthesis